MIYAHLLQLLERARHCAQCRLLVLLGVDSGGTVMVREAAPASNAKVRELDIRRPGLGTKTGEKYFFFFNKLACLAARLGDISKFLPSLTMINSRLPVPFY